MKLSHCIKKEPDRVFFKCRWHAYAICWQEKSCYHIHWQQYPLIYTKLMSENCSILTETVVIAFKVENSLKTNQTVKFIRVLPGSNSRACFHMIWKQLVNIIVVYRYNLTDSHLTYRVMTTASCLKTGPAAILEPTCSQNSRISNATTLPFTKTCLSTKLNWTYLPTYLPTWTADAFFTLLVDDSISWT